MSMSRRGFLGAMLGAMAAPAIVKAENLMKIVVPPQQIVLSPMFRNARGMSSAIFQIDEAAFYSRDYDGDAVSISDSYPKHIFGQNINVEFAGEYRYGTGIDRLAEKVLRDTRKIQNANLSGMTDMKGQERVHATLTRILGEMRSS